MKILSLDLVPGREGLLLVLEDTGEDAQTRAPMSRSWSFSSLADAQKQRAEIAEELALPDNRAILDKLDEAKAARDELAA